MGTEYSKTTCEPETQVEMVRNVDPTASSVRYMVTPNHENRVGCAQSNPELSSPSRNDCDSKSTATNTWLVGCGEPELGHPLPFPALGRRMIHFEHRDRVVGGGTPPCERIQAGSQHHVLGERSPGELILGIAGPDHQARPDLGVESLGELRTPLGHVPPDRTDELQGQGVVKDPRGRILQPVPTPGHRGHHGGAARPGLHHLIISPGARAPRSLSSALLPWPRLSYGPAKGRAAWANLSISTVGAVVRSGRMGHRPSGGCRRHESVALRPDHVAFSELAKLSAPADTDSPELSPVADIRAELKKETCLAGGVTGATDRRGEP